MGKAFDTLHHDAIGDFLSNQSKLTEGEVLAMLSLLVDNFLMPRLGGQHTVFKQMRGVKQ